VVGDLLLGWHEYDPPWGITSREKTRVRAPVS
jgi:hypothetical protein